MEFPELGRHCNNPDCKRLDFLPMKCDACEGIFCVSHYNYETHSCPKSYMRNNQVPICPLCNQPVPLKKGDLPDVGVNQHIENDCQDDRALKKRVYRNKCSFQKCKQRELVPINCPGCGFNYCLKHRHALDHQCPANNKDKRSGNRPLSRAAEAALRRFESSSSTKSSGKSQAQSSRDTLKEFHPEHMTEDEALAMAMAKSMHENGPDTVRDEPLARIARSANLRDSSRLGDKCFLT